MPFSNELHNRMIKAYHREPDGDVNLITIDYLHQKVHEGRMLFVSHIFRNVANGATVYIRHIAGPTKYLHSEVLATSAGQWLFQSYAGTTYTANGTLLNILNRKSDSTYSPEVLFYHTPTINVLGTVRLGFLFGSGTNPAQASTGLFSERLESNFAPLTDVLVGFTNESGSVKDISVTFNFYEEGEEV